MAEYNILHFVVGPVMTNCYVLGNDKTKQCIVVDPGAMGDKIYERIHKEGMTPVAILATHGHFDHMDGCLSLIKAAGSDIPIYIHAKEKETLSSPQLNVSAPFGMGDRHYSADIFLEDDEEIDLAGFHIRTIHTPGHTRGGCCYYLKDEGMLFSGDTLFQASVGRSDLPGGNMSELVHSVREKLFVLPDDTVVYPGHNDPTTIGYEKENNFFV